MKQPHLNVFTKDMASSILAYETAEHLLGIFAFIDVPVVKLNVLHD